MSLWLPQIYCSPFSRVGHLPTLVRASGALDLAAPIHGILPPSGALGAAPGSGPTTAPLPDHSPAWLAELLGVAPISSTPPLVLASALPPIPGKAVENMLKGQFIDFKEDLIDNVALMTQLQELGAGVASAAGSRSHLRDVSDPFTWVYCYLSFVVVLCPDSRTHELLAYGQIIIQLARSHGREGWLTYDCRWPQGHHLAGPKSTHHSSPLLSWVRPQPRVVAIARCACLGTMGGWIVLSPASFISAPMAGGLQSDRDPTHYLGSTDAISTLAPA